MEIWVLAYLYVDDGKFYDLNAYYPQVMHKGFKTEKAARDYLTWLDHKYPNHKSAHERYQVQKVTIDD